MPATSRWLLFDKDAVTTFTGETNESISGTGSNGYVEASSATSGTVTITTGVSDQFYVNVDGGGNNLITLTSGTDLDSRMVAREMEFKIQEVFDNVRCGYENNKFRVYSNTLGTTSTVSVNNGPNDCLHLLGMASSQGGPLTVNAVPGLASINNAAYTGQLTLGGQFKGQLSDIYTVMIGKDHPVGDAVASGANTYAGSTVTAGDWNEGTTETYTVTVSTTNGSVMNNGSGNVPTISWTSTQGDGPPTSPVELLYSDYWYEVGTKGLIMKFSDSPFGNGDVFNITCTQIQYAVATSGAASVGSAQYHWSSKREGKSSSATTTQVTGTAVGNKGLTVAFSNSGSLTARDEFRIISMGPQPTTKGVTILNYGAVTVSTYSEAQAVWFELTSGATVLSNPKFGLQSHGTASHHNQGNNDTKFAFGTAGAGTPASDNTEWHYGVDSSTDLISDVPPSYLAATEDNLAVVSTADASEVLGIVPGHMVTDFVWLAVKLGAVETGANPSIVYRMFYDFS